MKPLKLTLIEQLDLRDRTAVEIAQIKKRFDFVIKPGYVTSLHDNQRHWIGAENLIELYGVDRRRCVIVDSRRPSQSQGIHWSLADLPVLRPRSDGKYIRPFTKEESERLWAELKKTPLNRIGEA